jgi:hypothetical protein
MAEVHPEPWLRALITNNNMCIECWKTKAINTHSKYVILRALERQQLLLEGASVLICSYTASLV